MSTVNSVDFQINFVYNSVMLAKIKELRGNPYFWAIIILPFSSIIAVIVWVVLRIRLHQKQKSRIILELDEHNGENEDGKVEIKKE